MPLALLLFAHANTSVTGLIVTFAVAFFVVVPGVMTIIHVRFKHGRPVEFSDENGRVRRGTVVRHAWGATTVRIRGDNGTEYDVRLKQARPR
jgi:hypothetical protein